MSLLSAAIILPVLLSSPACIAEVAQTPALAAQPETSPLRFDVASIREDKPGSSPADVSSNVPLGPGNVYTPTGGLFTAKNFTVLTYLSFAYRLTDSQITSIKAAAPAWLSNDRFDIQARTEQRNASKDDLRAMVRSLLEERFGLAAHYENRQVPIYALRLIKPAEPGPELRLHSTDTPCPSELPTQPEPSTPPPSETVSGGFPATCGGVILLPSNKPRRIDIGARNIPLTLLANSLTSWGQLHYPVVDYTGLTGSIDFTLDYLPEQDQTDPSAPEITGPGFREALRQQLGLKLEPQKGEIPILILDHIEHLSPN